MKTRQDDVSNIILISIYRKFRYFRRRYDTVRYIDIESIFRYFRYIEATLSKSGLRMRILIDEVWHSNAFEFFGTLLFIELF